MAGKAGGAARLVGLQQAEVGGLGGQRVLSSSSALLGKGFFICLPCKKQKGKKGELHPECIHLAWEKALRNGLGLRGHKAHVLAVDGHIQSCVSATGECPEQKAPSVAPKKVH